MRIMLFSWRRVTVQVLLLLITGLVTGTANASPDLPAQPWSNAYPWVRQDLEGQAPLVVEVLVPLCSNAQIWCGSPWAGQPQSPRTNIYWGAVFGAKTIFGRQGSGWELVEQQRVDEVFLERAIYRRLVRPEPWGLRRSGSIEQIVVLHAVHGSHINRAVEELYKRAARGSTATFVDRGKPRTTRIHAVGYAGHNRLLDGIPFPPALAPARPGDSPIPSFVLACISEKYFAPELRQVGSEPLVMTRTYMAPEGYVVDAVVRGLGENEAIPALRRRVVAAYAKWQKLSQAEASVVFAPP